MKALKAICTATILALAVSVPTYAGDVQTPGYTEPPPPPPPASNITLPTTTSSAPGDMSTPTCSALGDMTPGLADVLWVLASMF